MPTASMAQPQHRRMLRTLLRDPVLLALLVIGVCVAAWYLSPSGVEGRRIQVMWCVFAPMDVTAAVLAWRVTSVPGATKPSRRFWRLICLAVTVMAVGDSTQAVTVLTRPGVLAHPADAMTGGPATTTSMMICDAVIVIAMLSCPLLARTRAQRLRFFLDAATVLVGAAVLIWCFAAKDAPTGEELALLGLTTAVIVVVLFGFARMLFGGSSPISRIAITPIIAGLLVQVASSFIVPDGPSDTSAAPWLVRVLPAILVATGPRIDALVLAAKQTRQRQDRRPVRSYTWLPYASITVTLATFLWVLPGGVNTRLWGVVAGLIVIIVLVIGRQLLAFADNASLIRQLDRAVAELREHETRLRHQANHDPLTGLLNRAAFSERATALRDASGPSGGPTDTRTVLMLIDLDDFKAINDTLGHAAGDALLQEVAQRLRAAVRSSDAVARLGGDEFAILLHPSDGHRAADDAARRIQARLADPVVLAGQPTLVRASIGAALGAADDDLATLTHKADIALYEAKDRGKAAYVRYTEDLTARTRLPQLPAAPPIPASTQV